MNKLINGLIKDGYLKTDRIIEAFSAIGRLEFVPKEFEMQADVNIALPIGYGQTVSQPLALAVMLEFLAPQKGQKILEVGSGSGWAVAILAHIVGKSGKVYALERKKELYDFGRKNVEKFGFVQDGTVEFYCRNGYHGFSEKAPFDRILVSAVAEKIPDEFKEQLKIGGRLVIPIGNSIFCLEKKGANKFSEEEAHGFSFVPLVEE